MWVPLNSLGSRVKLGEWLEEWQLPKERPELARRAREVQEAILQYEIPAYVVAEADENAPRHIFKRVNTAGISMTESEGFAALFPHGEPRPVESAYRRLRTATGFGPFPERLFLRCIKSVFDIDPKTRRGSIRREMSTTN